MNREQRRSQLNSNQRAPTTVNIRYGHNDSVVAIIFPEPVQQLTLSEEQTDSMIDALRRDGRIHEKGRSGSQ